MSARVLLASCEDYPDGPQDEAVLVDALAGHGIRARWAPWGSTVEDDLVILRSTWDYTDRREEFLAWCAAVPRLANPLPVVRRNTDKRYLAALEDAGLAVIPTRVLEVGTALDPVDVRSAYDEFVLKPVFGAGSRGAGRFSAATMDDAAKHLRWLHESGVAALLQPYQHAVDAEGETALVFIGGEYSHAFAKGAILTGGAVYTGDSLFATERLEAVEPDAAMRALAGEALAAATAEVGCGVGDLLYARVDLVRGADGTPLVLELELTEPSLGLDFGGEAALERFGRSVAQLLA